VSGGELTVAYALGAGLTLLGVWGVWALVVWLVAG
jgi:hypothetical protein